MKIEEGLLLRLLLETTNEETHWYICITYGKRIRSLGSRSGTIVLRMRSGRRTECGRTILYRVGRSWFYPWIPVGSRVVHYLCQRLWICWATRMMLYLRAKQKRSRQQKSPLPMTNGNGSGSDLIRNRTNSASTNTSNQRSSSAALSSVDHEPPWHHDSWVLFPTASQPTEIVRLSRRTIGYFPPARRKKRILFRSRHSFNFPRPHSQLHLRPPGTITPPTRRTTATPPRAPDIQREHWLLPLLPRRSRWRRHDEQERIISRPSARRLEQVLRSPPARRRPTTEPAITLPTRDASIFGYLGDFDSRRLFASTEQRQHQHRKCRRCNRELDAPRGN